MAEIVGPNSDTATVTATTLNGWWVKDPLDPARNVRTHNGDADWQMTDGTDATVHQPLGAALPVVTFGSATGESGQVTWHVPDEQTWQALERLRLSRRTLLLQSPQGEQMYVQVAGERRVSYMLLPSGRRLRRVGWPLVQVQEP